VDAEVTLRCRRVVAHLATIRLVTTRIGLASRQPRMWLSSDTVDARRLRFGMLLLHVDFECLLVLIVPVTLGALQGLAGIAGVHAG
jgi:hypothetical protein